MKRSELREIIKEEIYRIIDETDPISKALADKVGVKPTTTKNVMKYESLPGYNELPLTRADVKDFNKGLKLPSIDAGSISTLLSKEEVKKWFEEFKNRYKEIPEFNIEGTKIQITNPKFLQALDIHAQAVKHFGTKGD